MAAVRVDEGQALASHRPYQHVESVLGDQPPLKLHGLDQDVEVWWKWLVPSDSSSHGEHGPN